MKESHEDIIKEVCGSNTNNPNKAYVYFSNNRISLLREGLFNYSGFNEQLRNLFGHNVSIQLGPLLSNVRSATDFKIVYPLEQEYPGYQISVGIYLNKEEAIKGLPGIREETFDGKPTLEAVLIQVELFNRAKSDEQEIDKQKQLVKEKQRTLVVGMPDQNNKK